MIRHGNRTPPRRLRRHEFQSSLGTAIQNVLGLFELAWRRIVFFGCHLLAVYDSVSRYVRIRLSRLLSTRGVIVWFR